MTTNADILAALQRDVAAASPRPWRSTGVDIVDKSGSTILGVQPKGPPQELGEWQANARLAALDGGALLEALVTIDALTEREDIPDGEIIACIQGNTEIAIADAGKVLGL